MLTIKKLNIKKSVLPYLHKKKYNYIFQIVNESLFKYKNHYLFPKQVNLMFLIFTFSSSELLLEYILSNIKNAKKKKHYFFFTLLGNFLKEFLYIYSTLIKGIKIQIKGRLNSSLRKKVKTISYGKTALQTISYNVKYSEGSVICKEGVFGVKVWIFYTKNNSTKKNEKKNK